jgi:hypothetical protein
MADQPKRPPVKTLYLLVKQGDRTYFNRAGVGFVNRDGSINIKIDMFPDVSFQLRDPKSEEDT